MANANIYPRFENKPFASLSDWMTERSARETDQLRNEVARTALSETQRKARKEEEDAQRTEQRRQLAQDAFQQFSKPDGSVDQKAVIAYIQPRDYQLAQTLSTGFADLQKKAVDANKGELENQNKKWELTAQALQGVRPETYRAMHARIAQIDPEMAEFLGPEYDEQKIGTAVAMGTGRSEYNKNYIDWLNVDASNVTKALGLVSIAHDELQGHDAMEFAKVMNVDDDLAKMGFGQWTPDAPVRAQQFLMGPGKTADLAEQKADNQRQEATAAETARHNRATEGAAQANITLRRQEGAAANTPLPKNIPPQASAVVDRVLIGVPGTRTGAIKQGLSNLAQRGASEDQIKSYLRLAAVETLGQADKSAMVGRMQTISALKDAEALLQQVPTGMIKGTWEDTARALGTTSDPRMVELGTRMGTILANYMRSISGAAIADKEADRLGKLIPNYRNSLSVNLGQIKGFSDTLRSFDNAFYQYKFGDNYDWVMGTGGGSGASASPASIGGPAVVKWGKDAQGNPVRLQ